MAELRFHTADPPRTTSPGLVHVALYDGPSMHGFPRVGRPVRQQVRRLGVPVPVRAFDLLTVALAVTAADTFVNRASQSDTGWRRDLLLRIPLAEPEAWDRALPLLREALGFLTGDSWTFVLEDGGVEPPVPMDGRGDLVGFAEADRVCLFSGGLDSTIGVQGILQDGGLPLLVSHTYRLDKGRQEVIRSSAFPSLPRLAVLAHPTCGSGMHPDPRGNDITMRGRSFNFLAAAGVAAAVLAEHRDARVPLVVPENGFIAVNAPLSSRRQGSLSTRTTHPHFLGLMQRLFDALGIPADIGNPYEFHSKGEMLSGAAGTSLAQAVLSQTVSCGKWKRKGVQCGRCVPCLVRRASFHAAGVADPTPPYTYGTPAQILASDDRADLLALGRAARWTDEELSRAVGASGPLPHEHALRSRYEGVVRRGLEEVRYYLAASNVAV